MASGEAVFYLDSTRGTILEKNYTYCCLLNLISHEDYCPFVSHTSHTDKNAKFLIKM